MSLSLLIARKFLGYMFLGLTVIVMAPYVVARLVIRGLR